MVGQRRAGVVHAVGLPYRERSHFDAQQVLESGGTRPYELCYRLARPGPRRQRQQGARPQHHGAAGAAWPGRRRHLGAVGAARSVGRPRRPARAHVRRRPGAGDGAGAGAPARRRQRRGRCRTQRRDDGRERAARRALSSPCRAARAEFLAQPNGPQAAVLELGGWDTHANQANPNGALAAALRQLDLGLAALRAGLVAGGAWERTVVVVASEFGREVAVNGTLGTDHGTGGVAFVLGGAVRGGRVDRRLAGPREGRALRGPRPAHHDRPARGAEGRARRPPADRLAQPRRRGVPGQRQASSRCSCCAAEARGSGRRRVQALGSRRRIASAMRAAAPRCCAANARPAALAPPPLVALRPAPARRRRPPRCRDAERRAGGERELGGLGEVEGVRTHHHRAAAGRRLDQVLAAQRREAAAEQGRRRPARSRPASRPASRRARRRPGPPPRAARRPGAAPRQA